MEEYNRELAASLIRVQEDERQRLGRELHDETGHSMLMAIFRLDLALAELPPEATQARDALVGVRASLLACTEELHAIASALRPRILGDLGLEAGLRSLARKTTLSGKLVVGVEVRGVPRRLAPALELTIFRAVQEALTNACKHAAAERVCVVLEYRATRLIVRIDDDGAGLPPTYIHAGEMARPARSGLGLVGIRERVALVGGTFAITARPGGGTRLRLTLPLGPVAEQGEGGDALPIACRPGDVPQVRLGA